MKNYLTLENVTKKIKNKTILKNISFKLHSGEHILLFGSNGAGKSTLINILLGVETQTSGQILLNNLSPYNPYARKNLGVALQESNFLETLTVTEILNFIRSHCKNGYTINEILKIFLLDEIKHQPAHKLSGGQKRRLVLASAFINKPTLLVLDEPTVGLDNESKNVILPFIKAYIQNPDVSMLLTTHIIGEEILCNRVIHLDNGIINFNGTLYDFKIQTRETQDRTI